MKKVGILSGTFDPIHKGHIELAQKAIKACQLEKVFLLPEPRPRFKQGVKALSHRIKMAEIAAARYPKLGVIHLNQTQFSVTETLPVLQSRFSGMEICMIMGDDVLRHLAQWPRVEQMLGSTHIVIAARHDSLDKTRHKLDGLAAAFECRVKSTLIDFVDSKISSNSLRESLRNGEFATQIDENVYKYIKANSLYSKEFKEAS